MRGNYMFLMKFSLGKIHPMLFIAICVISLRTTIVVSGKMLDCNSCGVNAFYNEDQSLLLSDKLEPWNKHPWTVVFQVNDMIDGYGAKKKCMGNIISATYIVTTAECLLDTHGDIDCHGDSLPKDCVVPPENIILMTSPQNGSVPLDIEKDAERLKIKNVTFHPDFLHRDSDDWHVKDIALIQLANNLVCESETMPVCLPTKKLANEGMLPDLYMVGMANDTHSDAKSTILIEEDRIHRIEPRECLKNNELKLGEYIICTRIDTETICEGNAGAGIVTKFEGNYTLLGIHMGTDRLGCDSEQNKTFSNVKVYEHMDWIREIVDDLPGYFGLEEDAPSTGSSLTSELVTSTGSEQTSGDTDTSSKKGTGTTSPYSTETTTASGKRLKSKRAKKLALNG